jgi:hypothetical protein
MAFGQNIDLETGTFTDDQIIGKAMEHLRIRFGSRLPESFYGNNWKRAKLVMQVEGRDSIKIINALLPFAEAHASPLAERDRSHEARCDAMESEYPNMVKLMRKGLL